MDDPLNTFAVEVMWMACGTHIIKATNSIQAAEIAANSDVPTTHEPVDDSLRVVGVNRIN